MRIFHTKLSLRFAREEGISDRDLCGAVERAGLGLTDVDWGGGLVEQSFAGNSEVAASGFPSILLFCVGESAFLFYGFPADQQDDTRKMLVKACRDLAAHFADFSDELLEKAVEKGVLTEVKCDD